jgi:co-chaperonin GroES (HSP10)
VTELPSGTRVHYVDVGGVHSGEVESYMNKVKDVISRKTEPQYVVGDVVIYSVYGANEVRDGTGKFYLVPAREVWAKVV